MFETAIVVLIVLAAAACAARRAWRTLRPAREPGCASDCGCGDRTGDGDWARTP